MSNSDFDKNGLDSYGIHWLQYVAFAISGFAIFSTWAFFYFMCDQLVSQSVNDICMYQTFPFTAFAEETLS